MCQHQFPFFKCRNPIYNESVKASISFNLIAAAIQVVSPPTYKELKLGGEKLLPRFAQQGGVRIQTSTCSEALTTAIILGAQQHLT